MSNYYGRIGVTAVGLESSISLAGSEGSETMTITNNDSVNPAVVDLSDSLSYITWQSPDDGTATYAIEPGQTRDITFVRSGSVPGSGGPWNTTVSANQASGTPVTVVVEIHPISIVINALQAIATPTLSWDFASVTPTDDTHSVGDLTLGGATLEAAPDSFFNGILDIGATTDDANYFVAVNNNMNRKSGQDRAFVWCGYVSDPGSGERQFFGCIDSAGRVVAGIARNTGVSNFLRFQSNGYYDGGSTGSLTDLNTGTTGADTKLILFASYDATDDETTIGWYADGDGGFSTNLETAAAWQNQSSSSSTDQYYFGGHQNKAHICKVGAFAVYDQQITGTDLATVASIMGLT